jgi:hypothetical protein
MKKTACNRPMTKAEAGLTGGMTTTQRIALMPTVFLPDYPPTSVRGIAANTA